MSNHSGKFIAAIFAGLLAATSFAAAGAEDGAKPADNCLSGPKGTAPEGHHWYYRIDRTTKRQCWYSRAESDKTARAAPRDLAPPSQAASSAVATNPAPPPPSPLVPKSIADARAELTAPQMRIEQDTNVNAEPRGGMAPAASLQSIPRATAPDAPAPSSPVASRWPESSGVTGVSGDPRLAAAEPPASPQASAMPAPRPATTPVALATADALQERQAASMQMLLLVMGGALALAGVTASLVFRFGRAQATRPELRTDRRTIWDQVDAKRSSPPMSPDEDMPVWRANVPRDVPPERVPRDPRAPDDPERRVTEMLARLARSAQT